ncbi:hypothetical protein JRC49_09650 [Clostridiales bacterium FE2011]|nr:hypothetical protein JRC49_09650 [Clostridiales bacterium FE2011]
MGHTAVDLRCPNCNSPVRTDQKECGWCHQPVVVSTFTSVYDMPLPLVNKYANAYRSALSANPDNTELNKSIAFCYLKLHLYDNACFAFEKAIKDSFDDSEIYFYAAICLLKGKKAFLASRTDIDKAIDYINAANMIEPKGIYYYFLAYIKYDFFERKYLNTTPNYRDCLAMAASYGISQNDRIQLFGILNVAEPIF